VAAATAARKYGVGPESIEAWKKALGTTVESSTLPSAIETYLRSLGLQVEARAGMTLEDLADYWRRDWPVLVCCQDYMERRPGEAKTEYGHYLVYVGGPALGGWLWFQDPSADNVLEGEGSIAAPGKVMVAAADFLRLWYDDGLAGGPYRQYGIAVGPPKPSP
jgi:hypothetical protein